MECTIKEAYEGEITRYLSAKSNRGNFNEDSEPLVYYKSGLGNSKPNPLNNLQQFPLEPPPLKATCVR